MNELLWKITRPLTDESLIEKLETKICVKLPNDFIECVLKNNAGYPTLKSFKTGNGMEHVFNNLLTFDENKGINIFNTYGNILIHTKNKLLLPFAEDPFGNYICFDFSKETVSIVFWYHETNQIEIVCGTFTEFLTKLS